MVRRFRFGVFEADIATGELRKSGVRLRLQDQSFQVLLLLLERPGEIVSRDELRQKLWPYGTFVDFDHSLNSIVNKLRETLGDSASNPRFIETLARRGYRFLVPVEAAENSLTPVAVPAVSTPIPPLVRFDERTEKRSGSSLLTTADDLPPVRDGDVRVLFLLVQFMYLSFYLAVLAHLNLAQDVLTEVLHLPEWVHTTMIVTAAVGIPVRLYLISFVAFNVADLADKFQRLFLPIFMLDEVWALAPFLLVRRLGWGLALGATAALIYVPFAERTLVLMREQSEQE
jgi:cholera toxin transcriptional activator